MNTYDDRDAYGPRSQWRGRAEGFLGWLGRRPAESWLFFAAGLVLAGLFL